AVLRNVDTNNDGALHGDPSLPNRASRGAALATVRVRWNNGRGPLLRIGLQSPRLSRPPVRHRTGQFSRFGDSQVTRLAYPVHARTHPAAALLLNPSA